MLKSISILLENHWQLGGIIYCHNLLLSTSNFDEYILNDISQTISSEAFSWLIHFISIANCYVLFSQIYLAAHLLMCSFIIFATLTLSVMFDILELRNDLFCPRLFAKRKSVFEVISSWFQWTIKYILANTNVKLVQLIFRFICTPSYSFKYN